MKISTRVKLVVIGALLAAMFMVGSAWADEASVVSKITALGLVRKTGETGNTITVTGAASIDVNQYEGGYGTWQKEDPYDSNERVLLQLGDLTGLTIDWKANLTLSGDVNGNAAEEDGIQVIHFVNGTFKLTGGKIDIQTTGTGWTHAIDGTGNALVVVDGSTITGPGDGITADSENGEGVTVTSGTVSFPNGIAVNGSKVTMNGGTVNGLVVNTGSDEKWSFWAYGTANSITPWDYDEPPAEINYIVKSGAVWTVSADVLLMATDKYTGVVEKGGKVILVGNASTDIKGNFTIEDGAEMTISDDVIFNIYGTVTNKGTLTNAGTINNFSGNTIDNQGTLTNNGRLNNKSSGKIKNTGKIDNTRGTIVNDGTLQSDAAAITGNKPTGNPVEPINGDTTSSGSSGCNAGFSMFALAALALPLMRRK